MRQLVTLLTLPVRIYIFCTHNYDRMHVQLYIDLCAMLSLPTKIRLCDNLQKKDLTMMLTVKIFQCTCASYYMYLTFQLVTFATKGQNIHHSLLYHDYPWQVSGLC